MVRAHTNQSCVYAIDGSIQVFDINILSLTSSVKSTNNYIQLIPKIYRDHA